MSDLLDEGVATFLGRADKIDVRLLQPGDREIGFAVPCRLDEPCGQQPGAVVGDKVCSSAQKPPSITGG